MPHETVDAMFINKLSSNALTRSEVAFSVWRSGKTIDLNAYIAFSKDFIARYRGRIRVHVVNLDVIPGVQGVPPTKAEIDEAAEQGWSNMLQMEKAGILPRVMT